jgi:hypothetical protein
MFGWGGEPSYYPEDLLNEYKNIKVGSVTISINTYRNNDPKSNPTPDKGSTSEAMAVKEFYDRLGRGIGSRVGSEWYHAFSGKGSPAGIRKTLEAVYDYRELFIKTALQKQKDFPDAFKAATWMKGCKDDASTLLQTFADKYIGLDCSGFVGNFLRNFNHALKIEPNTRISDIYRRRTETRTAVDDICGHDIIIWMDNFKHIACVDSVMDGTQGKYYVCQSAGGGPRMNTYKFIKVGKDKFRLDGAPGYPSGDVSGDVSVVSLL